MKYTIYKHTLLIGKHAGWSYIGLTKQAVKRRWKHGHGYIKTAQPAFAAAIEKYGWENFSHEILEDNIDTLEKANKREQYWISYYHTWVYDPQCRGYNITKGGDGQPGKKLSAESKEKIRCAHLGKKMGKHSAEWRKHISDAHKQPIMCIETGIIYESAKIVFEQTGILQTSITNCLHGRSKTAGGFHWKFVKNSQD